jgi:hypothetical protein
MGGKCMCLQNPNPAPMRLALRDPSCLRCCLKRPPNNAGVVQRGRTLEKARQANISDSCTSLPSKQHGGVLQGITVADFGAGLGNGLLAVAPLRQKVRHGFLSPKVDERLKERLMFPPKDLVIHVPSELVISRESILKQIPKKEKKVYKEIAEDEVGWRRFTLLKTEKGLIQTPTCCLGKGWT